MRRLTSSATLFAIVVMMFSVIWIFILVGVAAPAVVVTGAAGALRIASRHTCFGRAWRLLRYRFAPRRVLVRQAFFSGGFRPDLRGGFLRRLIVTPEDVTGRRGGT